MSSIFRNGGESTWHVYGALSLFDNKNIGTFMRLCFPLLPISTLLAAFLLFSSYNRLS